MERHTTVKIEDAEVGPFRWTAPVRTTAADAVPELSKALRQLPADVFALYIKTKSFHWHMSGRHSRDYHLLLDEQADQLHAKTDVIAERTRKIGAPAIRSVGDISRMQRLHDNDQVFISPTRMPAELRSDNQQLTRFLRGAHEICGRNEDIATVRLIENWIDESEHRTWFLAETERDG